MAIQTDRAVWDFCRACEVGRGRFPETHEVGDRFGWTSKRTKQILGHLNATRAIKWGPSLGAGRKTLVRP